MTPEQVEREHTLATAVARFDALRARESLADTAAEMGFSAEPLTREEALELLALGEVIARKAGYGRQLTVRSARATGASWTQIGHALGTAKQAAWEAHTRWIDGLVERNRAQHGAGLDEADADAARRLAGDPD
jgi:hypothetical protein